MNSFRWRLGVCILASSILGMDPAGVAQQGGSPPPSDQQQERPTLRPRNAPPGEISSPDNSTTTNPRKLLEIHTLFVESIDNSLSERLVEAFEKLGRYQLVTNRKQADALVHGSCLESRRLKHVHTEVFISDREGRSIWQDTIYRPFSPPSLNQAVSETAYLLIDHLARSIHDAERQ